MTLMSRSRTLGSPTRSGTATFSRPAVEAPTTPHRRSSGGDSTLGQRSTSGAAGSSYMSCSAGACLSKMTMCRPCSPKSVVRLLFLSQCRNPRLNCSLTAEGSYHMPSSLSPDARGLINAMLAVDPVKRITIPEITQHPFYTTELPRYLTPLPPPPGPVLGTLTSLVTQSKVLDFEIIEGLGRIEEDVVDDLAHKMEGVDKEDIWECLRRDDGPQGNAVKVAYMLLRDKRRLGRDRRCSIFKVPTVHVPLIIRRSGGVRGTGTGCEARRDGRRSSSGSMCSI